MPSSQIKAKVTFHYALERDPGPYPIPANAPIEGGPQGKGDGHILIVDRDNCKLYELFTVYPNPGGSWQTGPRAIFDLRSNALRPLLDKVYGYSKIPGPRTAP